MAWVKVYEQGFFLHRNPRPKIYINNRFKTPLIAVDVEKFEGYDISFAGWLAPVTFSPHGNIYGKWKRLYFKQIQQFLLQPQEAAGSLEVIPKLWYPNITVRIWESDSEDFRNTDEIIPRLSRIEEKIDDISTNNR